MSEQAEPVVAELENILENSVEQTLGEGEATTIDSVVADSTDNAVELAVNESATADHQIADDDSGDAINTVASEEPGIEVGEASTFDRVVNESVVANGADNAVEFAIHESAPVENTAADDTASDTGSNEDPSVEVGEASTFDSVVSDSIVAGSADNIVELAISENVRVENQVADAASDTGSGEGSSTEAEQSEDEFDAEGRTVRLLSVGQKVLGKVKRITDFGAFVDIGVGRDGLIHVSELSVRRVGKVTDVLQENLEVDVWIKKLDRDRNRISLTLIEPGTKTIRDLEKDELVNGTVTRILPYGAFVDIGIGRDALLHIREMSTGYVARPEDVVNVGDEIEARVIELSRRRQRVDLSIKGLRAEPEVEAPSEVAMQTAAVGQSEEDVADEFANIEVLSPMELAFKRAVEAGGTEIKTNQKQRKKGKRGRSIQDEIIARTLGVNN